MILNRHEAQQNMGHTEIAQCPRQCGADGQEAVGRCGLADGVVCHGQVQIACHASCVIHYGIKAACNMNPEEYDNQQRNTHHNPLNQVCGAGSQKAAHCRIKHNNNRTDDHGRNIIHTEQGAEQLAACSEAACCIGDEENNDNHSRNAHQNILLIMISTREEIRDSNCIQLMCINTDFLCDNQPVQVCTDGKPDCRPANIRHTA